MSREDLIGAAVLGGAFVTLLAAAELWRRLGRPRPEVTRKLVHVGGGIACLFFPFLVRSPWVVLAMAVALSAVFAVAARTDLLPSLHGVERRSRGAEVYPLAVALIFFLTQGRAWLYLAALLVLAIGDAFAALVGTRYGSIRYEVEESEKSVEGSVVFLIISFLAIHLPMLLLTDLPRVVCVLAALLVAILATGFEAISLGGADNLFVPLATVFVLGKITTKPVPEIAFQNLSLVAFALLVALLVRKYPFFNVGASITVVLFAYGNWSLGSWEWAVPVVAGVAAYLLAAARLGRGKVPRLRVRTVARALVPLFLLLVAANMYGRYDLLFGPYLAACAAVLSFSLANPVLRAERRRGSDRLVTVLAVATVATATTALVPWLLPGGVAARVLLADWAVVVAVSLAVIAWEGRAGAAPLETWSACRLLLSLTAAGLMLGLQAAGLIPPWAPFS